MSGDSSALHDVTLVRWCENLPVFALTGVVLLPGDLMPLHIFEPRYCALIQHCMTHLPVFGIATPKEGVPSSSGVPQLHPEMGLVRVVQYHPLGEGRSDLMVQSIGRVRMHEERTTTERFRVVRATVCDDDRSGLDVSARRLRHLLLQLASAAPRASDEVERLLGLESAQLVDALASQLLDDPGDRLIYLRLDRYTKRAETVEGHLARYFENQTPRGQG